MMQEEKKLPFCGDRIKGTSDRELYVAPKSGG
jgi:hypothetical protein